MLCLFLQAAITCLNCLLDCCVAALGEATTPCLFVCESLWLWLAASSSAAEHTIGTKGQERKSCYSFPLEDFHCQACMDGQRLGKVRRWILQAPPPVVCDEVTPSREVLRLWPSRCLLWLRFKTDIDTVGWGAQARRLKGIKEHHDYKS